MFLESPVTLVNVTSLLIQFSLWLDGWVSTWSRINRRGTFEISYLKMQSVLFSHTNPVVKPNYPWTPLILNGHMLGLTFQPTVLYCNSKWPYFRPLPAGMMLISHSHKPFQSQHTRDITGGSVVPGGTVRPGGYTVRQGGDRWVISQASHSSCHKIILRAGDLTTCRARWSGSRWCG
jgi:hypothetical protein